MPSTNSWHRRKGPILRATSNDMIDQRRRQYLEAMGIDVWVRRNAAARPTEPKVPEPGAAGSATPEGAAEPQERARGTTLPEPPIVSTATPEAEPPAAPTAEATPLLDWDALQEAVDGCTRCPELVTNRTRSVFGVGDRNARWLVIGEAPGADEDRQGEPFVGRAGQLLNGMLRAVGLSREEVYIANILKCRPPRNRDPSPEETANCRSFLQRQIELIEPSVILVVGRIAAQSLLGTDQPLGGLRGQVHHHPLTDTPVVVTYHPAYLLRTPRDKRKAWSDLRLAGRTVRENISEG